jgi:hypothetical protein
MAACRRGLPPPRRPQRRAGRGRGVQLRPRTSGLAVRRRRDGSRRGTVRPRRRDGGRAVATVRTEVRAGSWAVRGGAVGAEVAFVRLPAGDVAPGNEQAAQAVGFTGRSPAFAVVNSRLLGLQLMDGGGSSCSRSPSRARHAHRRAGLGTRRRDEHATETSRSSYAATRSPTSRPATGRCGRSPGDVALAGPHLELVELESPPTRAEPSRGRREAAVPQRSGAGSGGPRRADRTPVRGAAEAPAADRRGHTLGLGRNARVRRHAAHTDVRPRPTSGPRPRSVPDRRADPERRRARTDLRPGPICGPDGQVWRRRRRDPAGPGPSRARPVSRAAAQRRRARHPTRRYARRRRARARRTPGAAAAAAAPHADGARRARRTGRPSRTPRGEVLVDRPRRPRRRSTGRAARGTPESSAGRGR